MLKPHLKKYWIIPPNPNGEFVAAMEDVLEVYRRVYDERFPVVCMDETSKQLFAETWVPIPMAKGRSVRFDYEDKRSGVANLFVFTELLEIHYTPKHGSWLHIAETELSVLTMQCFDRRIPTKPYLKREVEAWKDDRNKTTKGVDWQFTTGDSTRRLYRDKGLRSRPPIAACQELPVLSLHLGCAESEDFRFQSAGRSADLGIDGLSQRAFERGLSRSSDAREGPVSAQPAGPRRFRARTKPARDALDFGAIHRSAGSKSTQTPFFDFRLLSTAAKRRFSEIQRATARADAFAARINNEIDDLSLVFLRKRSSGLFLHDAQEARFRAIWRVYETRETAITWSDPVSSVIVVGL